MNRPLFALTFISALSCGLMAGVFFAFSVFVMNALSRLPAAQGIAAMQSINAAAINPLFGAALFGTAAACVLLTICSLFNWHKPFARYLLVGSLLYLVGAILVTSVFSLPQNKTLAAVDPASAVAVSQWADYLTSWTAWNHVRTAAPLAAAALLTGALCLPRDGAGPDRA